MTYIKDFTVSTKSSLENLAAWCEANDPLLEGINVFYGVSSLAAGPQAKKLGFEIHEIENPLKKAIMKHVGKTIIRRMSGANSGWHQYKKTQRVPKEAYISREKLVSLYGSRQHMTPSAT